MTFLAPLPWWLLAVLAAGAVVWATFAVQGHRAELSGWQRTTLAGVRICVVLLLLAILMRPVTMGTPANGSGAVVAVLVDASRSMSLADDGTTSRFDRAAALARAAIAPALDTRFVVRPFTFGESLGVLGEQARADAPMADLAGALLALPSAVGPERLAGVLTVSDGGVAMGSVAAARQLGVPVLAMGVGSEGVYRDREVLDVAIGDVTFAESTTDLTATVVSRGLADRVLDVTVLADGVPVAARRVELDGDGMPARMTVEVRPASDRAVRYTVRVAPASGELTTANNEASALAPPTRRRARVLLVEGAPGFEHSFLKRALEHDPALVVDAVVPKGRNDRGESTFYVQAGADRAGDLVDGWPRTRAALFAYDAVVLANASLRSLSRDQLEQLTEFVSRRGGGLVAIGSDASEASLAGAAPFAEVLPIDPVGRRGGGAVRASRSARQPGAVWLTAAGEGHPVMRQPGEVAEIAAGWSALPRLSASQVAGQPRPGASVLAQVAGPGGDPQPLVTVQRYGRGRVLAFTGEASWRWRMLLPSTDRTYETFWRQALRWVAAPAPGQVDVVVSGTAPSLADLLVDVRDAEFEPVHDAAVAVRASGPSDVVEDLLARRDPERPGRYHVAFAPQADGVYRIGVEARRAGALISASDAWLLAGASDGELRDPRRDDQTLRLVAEATGGRLVDEAGLRSATSMFDAVVPDASRRAPIDLWHNPWVLTVLLVLLCVEWTLRRRWGLR